ncbi:hypothetical protein LG296_06905 [Ureibacillus chungkukjangi]|uniref:hypothetical protein n=1 Tax=Ureibacillus chungkukjangi TaxID=1202712 RepID=UPI00384D0E38
MHVLFGGYIFGVLLSNKNRKKIESVNKFMINLLIINYKGKWNFELARLLKKVAEFRQKVARIIRKVARL